jgi:glycosyltransferase involved in cell wall biosynthesis
VDQVLTNSFSARNDTGAALRLVTLCGSTASKFDGVRNVQDIIEQRFTQRGITVRPVDLGDWSLTAVPRILRAIRLERPDIILMQYPNLAFGSSLGPVALGAFQRIAPLVVMLHEFNAIHLLRKLAIGALVARATIVGTTAERESRLLGRWYPWLRPRLRHIPIASNIPGRDWAPTTPPRIVYFGQIRPDKGLEEFLACQSRIAAAMPHAVFEIIGATVPKFVDYADMIFRESTQRGIIIRHAPETDAVADALATASVALLAFPEGASFRRSSLFAAAACGVPLVTNIGADTPADLVPYLEPAHTVDDLTEVALRTLRDPKTQLSSHQRSVKLSERYGWDDAIARYLSVFRELTKGREALLF